MGHVVRLITDASGVQVDWYPWGEEAFARARAEDKPIFLSGSTFTCLGCLHVYIMLRFFHWRCLDSQNLHGSLHLLSSVFRSANEKIFLRHMCVLVCEEKTDLCILSP